MRAASPGRTLASRSNLGIAFRLPLTTETRARSQPLRPRCLADLIFLIDGTMPDLTQCEPGVYRPLVLSGRYSAQIARAIQIITEQVDFGTETVASMHPWQLFTEIRTALQDADISFVPITREDEWPQGDEQVALTTMHSAKGLEFDHVFLLGLNDRFLRHSLEEDDSTLEKLRKLLAMAIGRARKSVVLGFLPSEKTDLIDYLDVATYDLENVLSDDEMRVLWNIIQRRGIREVVHFTRNTSLLGILQGGCVLARSKLPQKAWCEVYDPNAEERWDKEWYDYINLSISRINAYFFRICEQTWHQDKDIFWVLLAFDPAIMTHPGVKFTTTNNGYSRNVRRASGPTGFEALFAPNIPERVGKVVSRPTDHPDDLSTCPQAEVLYPERLSLGFLRTVYVGDGDTKDAVVALFKTLGQTLVDVIVDRSRFTS